MTAIKREERIGGNGPMTSDIVDRLRRYGHRPHVVCQEAADEIHRLRAALAAIGAWKHPGQTPHPLQLMAREALGDDERRDGDMIGQYGE